MTYPLGGMEVQNDDVGAVELSSGVYDNGIYQPGSPNVLTPAGSILGRSDGVPAGLDDGDLIVSLTTATDGSEIPIGILGSDVESDGSASKVNIRYLVSGLVRQNRLIRWTIGGPGVPGDPADITPALKDQLRDFTMVPLETTGLSQLDNQ